MYAPSLTRSTCSAWLFLVSAATLAASGLQATAPAQAQEIIKKLVAAQERLELTVNASRILTLEGKIPRAQVNNPDVLTVTPLSPNEIQISGTRPGVTQLNLWNEKGQIYTVDITVYGDVQELQATLKHLFPHSSVRALRISNSLVLTGFVDQPNNIPTIMRLAEDYAPRLVNNIAVGGTQQIVLHVQVMEVSRTKLRQLGFDFADFNGNDFIVSSISGLISSVASASVTGTGDTVRFGVVNNNNAFYGFLKALRQNDLMKILAEPKLVTISGRPASFNVGGEFPVIVPQSLGTVSIQYKKFGTQVEFVPLVLGNGTIRLEVRPRVSEIDSSRNVVVNNFTIPALRVREVDTGVELNAGQTLAIAGLVQTRIEAQNKGLPLLADIPWLGAAFRTVQETSNEIELLILVRPELVDALDPHEVPDLRPGLCSSSPCDRDLYWGGQIEAPPGAGFNDGACGHGKCGRAGCGHSTCGHGGCGQGGCMEYENGPLPGWQQEEVHPPVQSAPMPTEDTRASSHRAGKGASVKIAPAGPPDPLLKRAAALKQGLAQPIAVVPGTGSAVRLAQPSQSYDSAGPTGNAVIPAQNLLPNYPAMIGPVGYDDLR